MLRALCFVVGALAVAVALALAQGLGPGLSGHSLVWYEYNGQH